MQQYSITVKIEGLGSSEMVP